MNKKLCKTTEKVKEISFQEGMNCVSISKGEDFFCIFVQHSYPGQSICINGEKAVKVFIEKMKEFIKED